MPPILALSLPASIMESCSGVPTFDSAQEILWFDLLNKTSEGCSVVLTFESVDEILWCDHSNETSSAVLLHGTICSSIFYRMKFGIFLEV